MAKPHGEKGKNRGIRGEENLPINHIDYAHRQQPAQKQGRGNEPKCRRTVGAIRTRAFGREDAITGGMLRNQIDATRDLIACHEALVADLKNQLQALETLLAAQQQEPEVEE